MMSDGEVCVMQNAIIEVKHLSCKVGYKYLLHDISWVVQPGERWVVFGMNGCGKTSLLSIIAGFKHFTAGDVKLFGEAFSNENILQIRKKIGWVSSSFFDKYYSKESVMDIVLSGKSGTLGLDGTITLEDQKLAKALLQELHLTERLHYTFDMLSKGERQNVLIARALFSKPEILVLDEPCTGLDIFNREYLFQTIEQLALLKHMTIIYVTHYVEEIKPIFDHCLLMKNGRIFAQGATEQLFQDGMIRELLGYPVTLQWENGVVRSLQVQGIQSNIIKFLQ